MYNDDDDTEDEEEFENMVLIRWYINERVCYVVGYIRPTSDNQILEESKMLKEPDKFFSMIQYLLADAGYALGVYVCTPHR